MLTTIGGIPQWGQIFDDDVPCSVGQRNGKRA